MKFHFHRWIDIGRTTVTTTVPLLGPYDPRTEEQRTYSEDKDVFICAVCGKQEQRPVRRDYYY